ncbi:alpha/beta hydrolase [Mesorhizobium sp. CAU 1741]|uniref:alpha/beta fold hydrolase n=1 Tax=Mesorhizobium sp. CAU 1741 TaxID=3140366 RepID=UPI00325AB2A7
MNLVLAAVYFLLSVTLLLAGASRVGAWAIERNNPPVGEFADIAGARLHYVHVAADTDADLPPIVFIHGASGNLLDQMGPARPLLEGRAEMLFMDRPGYGWSERGSGNEDPDGQADAIAALMDNRGIASAVIVGHSFGAAVAAALTLRHPDKVQGVVFLSGATHPWPGGATSWYYDIAAIPFLGRLFVETLAWPGGVLQIDGASSSVFSPNEKPERYVEDAGIRLVLRPAAFRANAIDVAGLYDHAVRTAPRYGEIAVPTIVISGNRDTVVLERIHSVGLARDIPGAELVWVDNLGHKPDWVAPDLVAVAIEKAAGRPVDVQAAARVVEARIAHDAFGPVEPREEAPELSPAQ